MKLLQIALVLGVTPGLAAAEDADSKNPDTALAWSAGGLALSAGLVVTGFVLPHSSAPCYDCTFGHETFGKLLIEAGGLSTLITPAFGHWYAHDLLSTGTIIRGASAAAFGVGMVAVIGSDNESSRVGTGLVVLGAVGYATSLVYDLATARRAARDYNVRHQAIGVAPIVIPTQSGPLMGMGIGGSF